MTDPNQQPISPQMAGPLNDNDDKLWASLVHFGNIIPLIPALIIFIVFKDRGERVRVESKEALNWTINVTGVLIILAIIASIPIIGLLTIPLNLVLSIVNIIFAILGGVRVQSGGGYRYPVNFRWVK